MLQMISWGHFDSMLAFPLVCRFLGRPLLMLSSWRQRSAFLR